MPLYPTRFLLTLTMSCALVGCQGPRSLPAGSTPPAPTISAQQQAAAEALVDEGQALTEQGNTEEALDAFTQALQRNPKLTDAHLGIGGVFRTQGDYDRAAAAYRNAIFTDPNNFDARYFYGLTNQLDGLTEAAIASYQRALVLRPNSFPANRDMGSAHLQHGDAEAAIPYAQRATELDPESQAAWANLAAAYSLVGDYTGAVEAFRQTLELGDPAEPILLGLADAHIQLGNYQRAENVLRATLRTESGAIGYERLGFVLFRQARFEDGLAAYMEALKTEPEDLASLNGAGVCLMAMYLEGGEYDDALRARALAKWRTSLEIDRSQSMIIDLIARYSKE
ncbi:tetratricopeptide repeat protein [Phycisphaeraceae bacterium D3-23]